MALTTANADANANAVTTVIATATNTFTIMTRTRWYRSISNNTSYRTADQREAIASIYCPC